MENVQCKLPALPTLDVEQAIHGQRIEFVDKEWFLNDAVMPPGQEFLVLGIKKVAQRWENGKPDEAIVERPDRKLPDIEALNAAILQSEYSPPHTFLTTGKSAARSMPTRRRAVSSTPTGTILALA